MQCLQYCTDRAQPCIEVRSGFPYLLLSLDSAVLVLPRKFDRRLYFCNFMADSLTTLWTLLQGASWFCQTRSVAIFNAAGCAGVTSSDFTYLLSSLDSAVLVLPRKFDWRICDGILWRTLLPLLGLPYKALLILSDNISCKFQCRMRWS